MNYNINFRDIIFKLVPSFKRGTNLISCLYSIIKPLKDLNNNVSYTAYSASSTYSVSDKVRYQNNNYSCIVDIGTPESFTSSKWAALGDISDFYTVTQNLQTLLKFNSQTIYLEKFLNDKYDDTSRRITITTITSYINYLYNNVEGATPFYMYNNWNISTAYIINDRVYYNTTGKIYVCVLGHTGQAPTNPTYWNEQKEVTYFYNKGGGSSDKDFTANVPVGLLGANESQFIADVEKYRLAGKTWEIITF